MRHLLFCLLFLLPTGALAEALDYSDDSLWLCAPDNLNACDVNLDTTIVHADGSVELEPYVAASNPAIDCFYVYPTVSLDPGGNSDTNISPEERRVIEAQFARFGAACRTFAPLYRQVTLTALRARFTAKPMPADRLMAYADVKAAWEYYLEHHNNGRGVVLIGHSQGAGVLTELISREIEGAAIQENIVSALLIGTSNIKVPEGKDVGGTFKHMKLCRSVEDTGCIVNFASFRSDVPPPADSLFGRPRDGKGISACNYPTALAGGKTFANGYLAAGIASIANTASSDTGVNWTSKHKIKTPFVKAPGLLSAECVSKGGFNYLEVTVNSDVNDPRTDVILGDVINNGSIVASWGLHLIDMHLAMGDMVELVKQQGAAYLK